MGYDEMCDKFRDECGVFGVFNNEEHDVARMTYYALYALQHRGQESCGIAVNDNGTIVHHKDMGLVPEVFNEIVLQHLKGKIAVGHVRYSTSGGSLRENAQPIVVKYKNGQVALAHNGNIVNADTLRDKLEETGSVFQTSGDSEIILNLIVRKRISSESFEEALFKALMEVQGSYALGIMTPKRLIGVRDPLGIRPLCIGKIDETYILASESCALDAVGAKLVRDVLPGEIVMIDAKGLTSYPEKLGVNFAYTPEPEKYDGRLCIFEHIYFARPDTFMDGASVYRSRLESGKRLFVEQPADAQIVIGVPDSGLTAALGYSQASGIPYGQGLIKNRYVGRTFIKPEQGQREISVKIKLNALKSEIDGKKIVLVDDSIVRGTTSKRLVQILRDAGAKEVHMRISSPPVKWPCYYGIDTPEREDLIASYKSVEQINDVLGTDSLAFLSLEGLMNSPVGSTTGFCNACFTGNYPIVKDSSVANVEKME